MFRTVWLSAAFVVMLLVVAACTSGASTSRGELGSDPDETPTPTPFGTGVTVDPGVVIAPTPTPDGPRPLVVATLLAESKTVMSLIDGPALAGVVAEIDRLNEDGGVLGRPIELVRFDTQSRGSLAERHAERLAQEPPDLMIVTCDTEFSQPILDVADEAGIITISPCADDPRYLTGALGGRNFTLGAPAENQGVIAARSALERYGTRAMVLRDVTSPEALAFCDGFERAFRELGGTVTYRDEFNYDTTAPVLDRLDARSRDVSFITLCSHIPGSQIPGDIEGAPSLILNLRTLGFQAPIVSGSTVDEPGWFSNVPTLGEMIFVSWSSAYGNDPDDRINDLVARVRDVSDPLDDPLLAGVTTILGAESVEAWARAVEAAGSAEPARVASALGSFSSERFATGQISFVGGARMDIDRTYRVLAVQDGELSVIALEASDG